MNEKEEKLFNKIMNKIEKTPQKKVFKKISEYIFSPILIKKIAIACSISFLIGIFIGQISFKETNINNNNLYTYLDYTYEIEEMEEN
jgi:hypothetical protein